jgi:hypothetical protein
MRGKERKQYNQKLTNQILAYVTSTVSAEKPRLWGGGGSKPNLSRQTKREEVKQKF